VLSFIRTPKVQFFYPDSKRTSDKASVPLSSHKAMPPTLYVLIDSVAN